MAVAFRDCGCEDGWIVVQAASRPGQRETLIPCAAHNQAVWERLEAGAFPDNRPVPRSQRVPRGQRWRRTPERADIDG